MMRLLQIALVVLGTTAYAAAQTGDDRYFRVDDESHPYSLRHQMEAVVSGLEQNGNGFRSRTPALTRFEARAEAYDYEDLHARRMALYGSTELEVGEPVATDPVPGAAPQPACGTAEADDGHSILLWLLCLIGLIAGVVLFRRHRSQVTVPPR